MPQVAYVEFTYLKKKKTTVMDFFPLNQLVVQQYIGSRVRNDQNKSSLNFEPALLEPFCYHPLL